MTIQLRSPRREDVPAIVSALNEYGRIAGVDEETASEVESWFDVPSLDLDRDSRVAVVEGRVVGYGDVDNAGGQGTQFRVDLRVDPAFPQAQAVLLDFVEARAREQAAPDGRVRIWAPEGAATSRALLERRGYAVQRFSFRMVVDLDDDPPAPAWPDGMTVRTFDPERDVEVVYEAHQEAFSDEEDFVRDPFADWQHWAFRDSFDPDLWFLATDADALAGLSLCYPERDGNRDLGWVWILGVRRRWRQRGLATALLRHSFRELRARGKKHAGLGVNSNNPNALRLYERAGMRLERKYIWYERDVT